MATCPTNPTKPAKPAWNPGAECDCPPTQTPSPGGPVCRYTWQCYWHCTNGNYSRISEIPQARRCIDDCADDADWHFTARVGAQCFYEISLCSPWECEADPECENLAPPGSLTPTTLPHGGDEPPHSECGCVPTPTPSPEPEYICRYQWMCTYDCEGTPPGWGAVGKYGEDCILFDDCYEDVWTFDAGSSTNRYQVYRKQTCEFECTDHSDCFDHTPVTPDPPTSTPACPTPTPSVEPTGTPTPTIDPDAYYCIHYNQYLGTGCSGTFIASGTTCALGSVLYTCVDYLYYSVYFDAIVDGPWTYPCSGHCT